MTSQTYGVHLSVKFIMGGKIQIYGVSEGHTASLFTTVTLVHTNNININHLRGDFMWKIK